MIINGKDTKKASSSKDLSYYKKLLPQNQTSPKNAPPLRTTLSQQIKNGTAKPLQTNPIKETVSNLVKPVAENSTVAPILNTYSQAYDNAKAKVAKVNDEIKASGLEFTDEQKSLLRAGNYKINPNYNPNDKFSQKIIYTGALQTKQDVYNNSDLGGKARMIASDAIDAANKLPNMVSSTSDKLISDLKASGQEVAEQWNKDDNAARASKIFGTLPAVAGKVGVGVAKFGEGIADTAITLGSGYLTNANRLYSKILPGRIGEFYGNAADKIESTSNEIIKKQFVEDLLGKSNEQFRQQYSYLPSAAGNLIETTGNVLPSIATGSYLTGTLGLTGKAAEIVSMSPFATQVFGSSTEEALNSGASRSEAVKYGMLSALVETGVEMASGGIQGTAGNQIFEKVLKNKVPSKAANNIIAKIGTKALDLITDATFEGLEEVASDIINPYIKRITYDPNAENATGEELSESFWGGFLSSVILRGMTPEMRNDPNNAETIAKLEEMANEVQEYKQNSNYSQYIPNQNVNSIISKENITGLPKNDLQNSPTNQLQRQGNEVILNQTQNAQNGNVELKNQLLSEVNSNQYLSAEEKTRNLPTEKAQQTLQSAQQVGMTDMDIKKATDLNNLLRSGAKLVFYNETNVPQIVGPQNIDKAKIANGFYNNGTVYINKNSKNAVQQILGHELTHYTENANMYRDMANYILDSNAFYEYLANKGFSNITEYKQDLQRRGYNEADFETEMVAEFCENELFSNEDSIGRIARENRTLVQKIKNWISDLIANFKGTTVEKELRKIESMYNKALSEANQSNNKSTNISMSIETIPGTNKQYVKSDRQVISGDNPLIWEEQVENYINDKIRNNTDVNILTEDGELLTITKDTAGKAKFRNDVVDENGNRRKLNNKEFATKLRAETHIDELAETSKFKNGPVPDGKNHNFAKDGFTYRTGYFEDIDGQYYKVTMSVGKNGEINTIYNIGRMDFAQKNRNNSNSGLRGPSGKTTSNRIASIDSITPNEPTVNTDYAQNNKNDTAGDKPAFSMPSKDNQGRTLTPQQQEYFKDSKVRDDSGNLKVMYHGTDADFNVFNYDYLGKNGTAYGRGFYFTDNAEAATSYGNKLKEVYLNITKPMQIGEKTMSKSDFKKLIEAVNKETNGTLLLDYGGIDEAVMEYDYGGDDIDLTNSIMVASGLEQNKYFRLLKETLGYDGIKANNKTNGKDGNIYLALTSEQVKNVDNTNPTSNEDIRYSVDDDIDKLNEEYDTIEPGEKSTRDVKIPKRTGKDQYVSKFARTLAEAGVTTDEGLNLLKKEIVEGKLSHEEVTDKRSLNYAEKYIRDNGWEETTKDWDSWVKSNKSLNKDELAVGQLIYNNAVQAKDVTRVTKMIGDLTAEFSEAGRSLQAARLLKKMTPDGRLYALERSVQKINQDLQKQISDFSKENEVTIPDEMAKELLEATPKEIDAVVEKIEQHIADQIPPTWTDKLNAWRYLAMLGNPRTHVRNVGGNALMVPVKNLKNEIGVVLEKTLPKEQRTKAILNPFNEADNALKDFARNDFDQNAEMVRGESKYDVKAGIKEKQRVFANEPLERLRKANFNALEAEDAFFLKMHYAEAFAEAMKARGITVSDARSGTAEMVKTLNEIRTIATNEAQKATYRDFNALAQALSKGKSNLKKRASSAETLGGKLAWGGANLAAEGILPFAKTPANIVRRGIEYSPLGLATGIYDMAVNVKKGKLTGAQAIDKISAGLSGTGIVALGMLLAKLGLVTGGESDDDKEQYFEEMTGMQNYALKLGKYNYTIDWSAPASMPLFVGVELWNSMQKENADFEDVVNAVTKITEPVFELSMLQGINSTIKSASYGENAIASILTNTAKSYVSQYNPTLLGQIARTIDDTRRTTYEDKNKSFSGLRKFGQQQLQKAPFASKTLLPRYDQFGRKDTDSNVLRRAFENFISPGYISEDKSTPVENELNRIYKQTGEKGVLPTYASKNVTVNGQKINFTQKQYEEFTVTRGQTAYDELDKLFKSNSYKNLSDEDKAELVADVYSYATKYAKSKVTDYEPEAKELKISLAQKQGINPYQYLLILQTADTNGNGAISQDEFKKATNKTNLTASQKAYLQKINKKTAKELKNEK